MTAAELRKLYEEILDRRAELKKVPHAERKGIKILN